MTRRDSIEDDLLPLSAFSSASFSALDLAKKRLLISQGEMSKLINDYERATSIELISLVNENYKSFLQTSNDVRSVSDRIVSLRTPMSQRYQDARKEVDSLVFRSKKMQDELHLINDTRSDISFLRSVVRNIQLLDQAVSMDDCGMLDLDILSLEYERVHAELEAAESVLAEGTRRGSPLLRDQLVNVREELARVRADMVHKLIDQLDLVLVNPHESVVPVYESLLRLQANQRFIQIFRSLLGNTIAYAHGEDLAAFLTEVTEKHLSNNLSQLARIAEPLLAAGFDITKEVFYPFVVSEVNAKTPMTVFIPTASNASIFFRNLSACRKFFAKTGTDEIVSKFKTSIYVAIHIKRVNEMLATCSGPDQVFGILETELLRREDVCFADPVVASKIAQFVFETIARLRTSASLEDLGSLNSIMETHLPRLKEKFSAKIFSQPVLERLFKIERALVEKTRDRVVSKIVTETCTPLFQTLDSVKQISALYRVASRGAPTRHSVYIDLAIKGFTAWNDSLASQHSDATRMIVSLVIERCISSLVTASRELLAKEKSRSGPEYEKIEAQVYLDVRKLASFFRPYTINWDKIVALTKDLVRLDP
jgi:hypothetical protein